jgi:predicted nucleotidyltransferase
MKRDRLRYLNVTEQQALAAFLHWLHEKYGERVLQARLFGSKVRGEFDSESDLDVLVVVGGENRWLYWRDIVDETSDLLLQYNVVISPLILDERQVSSLAATRASVWHNAMKEGADLWTSALSGRFAAVSSYATKT